MTFLEVETKIESECNVCNDVIVKKNVIYDAEQRDIHWL